MCLLIGKQFGVNFKIFKAIGFFSVFIKINHALGHDHNMFFGIV